MYQVLECFKRANRAINPNTAQCTQIVTFFVPRPLFTKSHMLLHPYYPTHTPVCTRTVTYTHTHTHIHRRTRASKLWLKSLTRSLRVVLRWEVVVGGAEVGAAVGAEVGGSTFTEEEWAAWAEVGCLRRCMRLHRWQRR